MSSVAGILEAQLTQHIALFEKMCGPVKHVRLAVRRRKNGGQGRGRKRKSDERVVVDVASWEEEEVQSFRVVPAGAESSELLARRIKLVKFDERLGAGAEGAEGGSGGGMRGRRRGRGCGGRRGRRRGGRGRGRSAKCPAAPRVPSTTRRRGRPSSATRMAGVRGANGMSAPRVPNATRQRRRPSSASSTAGVRDAKCTGA